MTIRSLMGKSLVAKSLVAGAVLLVAGAQAFAADAPAARVTALKGNVVWHQAGQAVPKSIGKGDQMFAGDEVSTEAKSHVTVALDGDAEIILGEKALLAVVPAADRKVLKVNDAHFVAHGAIPVLETECGTVSLQKGRLAQAQKDGGCAFYLHEGTATIKNTAGLTVLTAGQGVVIAGQGPAGAVSTWAEEQVKFMRAGLPQGAVPSLTVEPPKPKAVAPKEEKKEAPPVAETAPVAETPAVGSAPAIDAASPDLNEVPEPALEPVTALPATEEAPVVDMPVIEAPVVETPVVDETPEMEDAEEIFAPGVEVDETPLPDATAPY